MADRTISYRLLADYVNAALLLIHCFTSGFGIEIEMGRSLD